MFAKIILIILTLIPIAAAILVGERILARRAMDGIAAQALDGVTCPERREDVLRGLIGMARRCYNLHYTPDQAAERWGIANRGQSD